MSLPQFQNDDEVFGKMQNQWATYLDPLLANPANKSLLLKNVNLTACANSVNHLLARKLQGWKIVRQRAAAQVYDTQDSNPIPQLTLTLIASAPVVVDLEVF